MAGSSLLALIDDIATLLDDIASMTKVAARKTAGVLGDDLALNAQQVSGISPDRELPVVMAVAKGSAINKVILVPSALAISAVARWAVHWLLMVGGAYLCFEGAEKIAHRFLHGEEEASDSHAKELAAVADPKVDLVAFERDKIKGAVRTDFVLSAEIIVLALGVVEEKPLFEQALTLAAISVIMTVFVYGLVGLIVKLDDMGLALHRRPGLLQPLGLVLVRSVPWLMKGLGFAGTVAMFMVGGSILAHGIGPVHHVTEALEHHGGFLASLGVHAINVTTGLVSGLLLVGVTTFAGKLRKAE